MKTSRQSVRPNRRMFLKGIGVAGVSSLFVTSAASGASRKAPERYAHRFELHAEGSLLPQMMVWPVPQIPSIPGVDMSLVDLRVTADFPAALDEGGRERDLLRWYVFMLIPQGPGKDPVEGPISKFYQRAERITVAVRPHKQTEELDLPFYFAVEGPIVANPVPSPFGVIEGLPAISFANFDQVVTKSGEETKFGMLGGAIAGSHATAAFTASGILKIKGPWNSF